MHTQTSELLLSIKIYLWIQKQKKSQVAKTSHNIISIFDFPKCNQVFIRDQGEVGACHFLEIQDESTKLPNVRLSLKNLIVST